MINFRPVQLRTVGLIRKNNNSFDASFTVMFQNFAPKFEKMGIEYWEVVVGFILFCILIVVLIQYGVWQ